MLNALYDAILNNDAKKIEELIQAGVDVSHPQEGEFTPLMSAVVYGAGDAFKTLYENGAPINTIGHENKTALDIWQEFKDKNDKRQMRLIRDVLRVADGKTAKTMMLLDESLKSAIRKQDKKAYEELLQKGARLNCGENEEDNALVLAYQTKNPKFFKRVLEDVTEGDMNSPAIYSFLGYLIAHNEVKGIKDFVKMGGDVNLKDDMDDTLLIKAIRLGQNELVQTLSALGADLKEPDNEGFVPLDIAFMQNKGDVFISLLRALEKKQETVSLPRYVSKAVQEGHDNIIDALLNAKVALAQNKEASLLHLALTPIQRDYGEKFAPKDLKTNKKPDDMIKAGRLRIAESLIDAGADVNQKDENGNTPLLLAIKNGYSSLIDPLLLKKADIETINNDEMNALKLAICYGTVSDVDLLVLRGANVNASGENGYTALMLAALGNNTDMMRVLLENEANVNAQNKSGDTALLMAAENGNWPAIKCLLEYRANKEIKNNNGDDFLTVLGRSFAMLKEEDVPEVKAFLKAQREKARKNNKSPFLKRILTAMQGK